MMVHFRIPSLLYCILAAGMTKEIWQDVPTDSSSIEDPSERMAEVDEFTPYLYPLFKNNTYVNVSVQIGEAALFKCNVANIGMKPDGLSWVRRRDLHVLTSGNVVFTNDERFHLLHRLNTNDWTLKLVPTYPDDAGIYECQVGSASGVESMFFRLKVTIPAAVIMGQRQVHVNYNSSFSLVCIFNNTNKPIPLVHWHHNGNLLIYEATTHRIELFGNKSTLSIYSADFSHSGNYTCSASHAKADTIFVFVTKDEQPAAIQDSPFTNSMTNSVSRYRQDMSSCLLVFSIGTHSLSLLTKLSL